MNLLLKASRFFHDFEVNDCFAEDHEEKWNTYPT